jgi:hypothetical protein
MDSNIVWRKSSHLPDGTPHGFVSESSTIAGCGREEHVGNIWSEPLTEEPTKKCKTCVYVLEGVDVISRVQASGGGILHV